MNTATTADIGTVIRGGMLIATLIGHHASKRLVRPISLARRRMKNRGISPPMPMGSAGGDGRTERAP
jgi:hypothetical protein